MCPARTPPQVTRPDTIVLIHGMHLTPLSWESWVHRYTAAGYRVLAPAWPGLEVGVEALRRDPTPLAGQTVRQIVQHYAGIVTELARPPIIIGHCYGGTFTQLLLDRGLGAAGVALGAAPTRGVARMPWSTVRAQLPILGSRGAPAMPAEQRFHYALTNAMPADEAAAVYRRQAVPAARHVVVERAFADLNPRSVFTVDYGRPGRAPLLFVAGSADHQAPPALVRANAARYRRAGTRADYLEFAGRCHFALGQEGWTEIADQVLAWAEHQTSAERAA